MSRVETNCPHCQTSVVVPAQDVRAWRTSRGAYLAFVCPECDEPAAKRVSHTQLAALENIGAPIFATENPDADHVHPERSADPQAPPLVWDDLLDFHRLLQTSDWLDRLTRTGSRG